MNKDVQARARRGLRGEKEVKRACADRRQLPLSSYRQPPEFAPCNFRQRAPWSTKPRSRHLGVLLPVATRPEGRFFSRLTSRRKL